MRSLGERTGFRSSRSQTSNLVLESLFDKALGLKACDSIKKSLRHRCFPMKFAKSSVKEGLQGLQCFPVNIAKFLRTPILKNICERLFLKISISVTNLLKGGNS